MNERTSRILIVVGSLVAALLIVVVVVMLTGGDSDPAAGSTSTAETSSTIAATTTSASESTTTSSTAATTTTAAATTTAAGNPCDGLASAVTPDLGGPGVSHVTGDFDGDGSADQFIMYEAGGAGRVQMRLSYGYATELEVLGPVEAYGADEFGFDEELAYGRVFSGASTEFIGFFYLDECEIRHATVDGAGEATFGRGGGVTHLDGITCVDDGVITKSATTEDGTSWEYTETRYLWVPGMGDMQAISSSVAVLTSPGDDDTIFSAGEFNCSEG